MKGCFACPQSLPPHPIPGSLDSPGHPVPRRRGGPRSAGKADHPPGHPGHRGLRGLRLHRRGRCTRRGEQLAVLDTVAQAAAGFAAGDGPVGLPPARHSGLGAHPELPGSWPGCWCPRPTTSARRRPGCCSGSPQSADASTQPVMIYDIPARTGVALTLDTLRTLAHHPNITAIKDCGGDLAKTQALIGDGQLQVLAGDDANIFSTLALGGAGRHCRQRPCAHGAAGGS